MVSGEDDYDQSMASMRSDTHKVQTLKDAGGLTI